jgi:hypothetical protein
LKFAQAAFMNPFEGISSSGQYSAPLADDPDENVMVSYLAREDDPLPPFGE